MSIRFALGAVILIVAGAVFGGIFGKLPATTSADSNVTPAKIIADYSEAIDVIDKNYVGKVDH